MANENRNSQNITANTPQALQDDIDNNPSVMKEVNSAYSQAAILQAAPSLMSIRSCFVSSPSQSVHQPKYSSMTKQAQHQKNNLSHQHKKPTSQIANQQQTPSLYQAKALSSSCHQQQPIMINPSVGNLQQTQSQPQLSSPCYSSQPFLASMSGNNQYKKSSAIHPQTVLQYKNGVLQLTSIGAGPSGPRGMSSSADKLTLPASCHNSNTSLPFHEQVKNLSKLVKTNQNIASTQAGRNSSNQNILLNGSANFKLINSSNNSVSSSLQSEIDVEPTGLHTSSQLIHVGGLCGGVSSSLDNNLKINPMCNKVSEN